jgi:hypothetical protein
MAEQDDELGGQATDDRKVYRVVGPPGCGKTTWLARQCAAGVRHYGSAGVLVSSLTRAAAAEAAGRNTGLAKGQVGTLHSHCYHSLGRPKIIGGAELAQWNRDFPEYPMSGVTVGAAALDGDSLSIGGAGSVEGQRRGDEIMIRTDMLRSRNVPVMAWPNDLQAFHRSWSEFKRTSEVMDFTDLIEHARDNMDHAPGRPRRIFIDEAQDLSRLELDVIEKWAEHTDSTVLVGDEGQALYSWRGASPDVLAGDLFLVLRQSYRVPHAVQRLAMRVAKASGSWREETEYFPRRTDGNEGEIVEGEVLPSFGITWRRPDRVLDLIEEAEKAGENLMILATCAYLLGPTQALLGRNGIRWHNPFSRRFNPIGDKARESAAAIAYLGQPEAAGWSAKQFAAVVRAIRTVSPDEVASGVDGVLRGGKSAALQLHDRADGMEVARAAVRWLTPGALMALEEGDIDWAIANIGPTAPASMELALRSMLRRGQNALQEEPSVILGTIHSVKGGEATRVLVFPDISPQAAVQIRRPGWDGAGAVFRTFYVGVTRARERLYVAGRASALSVPLMKL